MKKTISILGCGWLGLPLAQHLISLGYTIKGSTTSNDKIELLKTKRIEPYLISVHHDKISGEIDSLLQSDILIINIPPGRSSSIATDYPKTINQLLPFIKSSTIQKVIFVSSTSVYGSCADEVTESTELLPERASGQALQQAEEGIKQAMDNYIILRPAGLIGPARHPGRFLTGKSNLQNPHAPVNLVHLDDCIGVITELIQQEIKNEIFNLCADDHPTREEYYSRATMSLGFELPVFSYKDESKGKLISNSKVKECLGYRFKKSVYYWEG